VTRLSPICRHAGHRRSGLSKTAALDGSYTPSTRTTAPDQGFFVGGNVKVLRNHRFRKQKVERRWRTQLVRFNGAVERDPDIDVWMKEHPGGLGAIAHRWFEVMRKCGNEVRELWR